jgi:hypothetical protein
MIGTTKGVFLLRASAARQAWTVHGPLFRGHAVYALALDARGGRRRLWAATESAHWGALIHSSDDLGERWASPDEATLKFPADTGLALKQVWQLCVGREHEPGTLYCGVAPAALFESRDDGASWSLVRGLHDHPHRARWEPGFGGLCLHTILPHPTDSRRMLVAISTGGVYVTDDGGASWQVSNIGIRADFRPDKYPEFGQCVHKVARHPAHPERLFLQNHWGLYRSDDGARSWRDIARGVPSDFGFPLLVHPREPETVYAVPLHSDEYRCTPDGKLRVYRTRDGGGSWEPLSAGLPQADAHETVLRDCLASDEGDPAGVYFGTRSGKLYGSLDGGDSWRRLADGLPPVTCVRAAALW